MSDWIECIDARIYKNDDGTYDCSWLDPYIGDITYAEWHKRGTALGVRRGCEYCVAKLEWETRCKDEEWNDNETVCQGECPDWPGEICQINKVVDSTGEIVGYEVQHKLYSSLHELEFYGWELQYSWYRKGKEIYGKESAEIRCKVMGGCGPKEAVSWCSINHSGWCSLDTASYEEMDRLASRCGFIRVNNRYLLWKYGVPYKDLDCGNCEYFEGGAYSYGNCKIEPSPKGITVNGEKTYIETKERYSGCRACEMFVKKGSEENVPKKTYYTKCGRQFEKSSTADVTGYEMPVDDKKCAECPFQIDVREGYPETKHKRWECRAGSKEPNHKTEWVGSLEDKNTIGINSLDHQLMEEIRKYCIDHSDLGAGYNTDHLADCRKSLSISCSQNKKGIAAKKALIDKFFPTEKAVLDEKQEVEPSEDTRICGECKYCQRSEKAIDHPCPYKCFNAAHRPGMDFYFPFTSEACANFEERTKVTDDDENDRCCCENCGYSEDYGESVEYIKCAESGKRKDVRKKQTACANYIPSDSEYFEQDDMEGMDLEDQLEYLLKTGDEQDKVYVYKGLV